MKIPLKILTLVFLMGVMSCSFQKPISIKKSENNDTYKVEYLFEHEGIKVYRFRDYGNYVYFTNCNSDITVAGNDSTKNITTISRKK